VVYGDGLNSLGENINTIERNTEAQIDGSKGAGVEIDDKYTFMSCYRNAAKSRNIKT
jgi:hypothetical protein